jgi:pimeloyl-ACP methyl ester carboxylesterase
MKSLKLPLVLVAYSSSALMARAFARSHPDLLAGLVFLDPTMPAEIIGLSGRARYDLWVIFERNPLSTVMKTALGWRRLKGTLFPSDDAPTTRAELQAAEILDMTSHWWATAQEGAAISRSAEQAHVDWSTNRVPVTVVSTSPEEGTARSREAFRLRRRMAEESHGRFEHRPGWSHDQISRDPAILADLVEIIGQVVALSNNGSHHAPPGTGPEGAIEKVTQVISALRR